MESLLHIFTMAMQSICSIFIVSPLSFMNRKGPHNYTDLHFRSPHTPAMHFHITDTGLVHCLVCMSVTQLLLVLTMPAQSNGQAELTWMASNIH